jgi:poly-gamma-glutamate capsule biosynthesis protein CapA/YwtB (metallophosphatase superfamily)
MAMQELSIFLGGDALMVSPWSRVNTSAFLGLVQQMRDADVTILNLETVVRGSSGHARPLDSAGIWYSSPPEIANELAWAGVDMVSHANNHAFDYGCEGLLETIEHINRAGIALSGSGKDLQAARHFATRTVRGTTLAHVAMAERFVAYGYASRSRPDFPGRPGVNHLPATKRTEVTVTPRVAAAMRRVDGWLGRDVARYERTEFARFGWRFRIGRHNRIQRGRHLVGDERRANLEAISAAAKASDLTVMSLHTHDEGLWGPEFLRDAVAAGADVILMHGPHRMRGVEILNGRPVFHCLGNFVFQILQIAALPAEAYDSAGLEDHTSPAEVVKALDLESLLDKRRTFESCAAVLRYDESRRPTITLLPIDLQFGTDGLELGRPQLADRNLGRRIIEEIAAQSKRHGTRIRYDEETNTGIVET